jgi:TRAP-type C4-dicarboxylate transport system permease small subunit
MDRLSLALAVVASVTIMIMIVLMLSDGISRKAIGSIPGAYETSKMLILAITYLPQGYVQMRRRHISISFVIARLSKRAQAVLNGIAAFLGFGFFALLTWLTCQEAWISTLHREFWMADINYPVWPFRWLVPLGVGLLAAQFLETGITAFNQQPEGE